MRLRIDKEAEARYLRLDESKIIESDGVAPGISLDFNERNVVGVEMVKLFKRGNPVEIEWLVFETLSSQRPDIGLRESPPRYGAKYERDQE